MVGTKAGGLKAAATNKVKYGENFYSAIGRKGGQNGHTGGFAANRELARIAGAKGGRRSVRGVSTSVLQGSTTNQSGYITEETRNMWVWWLTRAFKYWNNNIRTPDEPMALIKEPKKHNEYYQQVKDFIGNGDTVQGWERSRILMAALWPMYKKHEKDARNFNKRDSFLAALNCKKWVMMAMERRFIPWNDFERAYKAYGKDIDKQK